MNMEGWVLLGADRQEVAVAVYPGQDLVEADLSDVPDVYQDLHWHAPKTYLGDKVRPVKVEGKRRRRRDSVNSVRTVCSSLTSHLRQKSLIMRVNKNNIKTVSKYKYDKNIKTQGGWSE